LILNKKIKYIYHGTSLYKSEHLTSWY